MSSTSNELLDEEISIAIKPGVVVNFRRQDGQFDCSCDFKTSNEAVFRTHYRESHSNETSVGIISSMTRTFSYVASVFSTPSARRKRTPHPEPETPPKRRRLDSIATPRLPSPKTRRTSSRTSLFSSQIVSIPTSIIRSILSSKYVDVEADNLAAMSPTPYRYPHRTLYSSQISEPRLSSSRDSTISNKSMIPQTEEHRRSSPSTQTIDLQTAQSHLRSLGLFVHQQTNVVVCAQCASGVLAESAVAHVSKAPSHCRSPTWRTLDTDYTEECLRACDAFKPVQLPSHDAAIEPLPMIPVYSGWQCVVDQSLPCFNDCFASDRARDRHFFENHKELTDRSKYYVETDVQRIYNYRGAQRCIRVNNLPPRLEPPRYDAFLNSFPKGEPLPDSNAVSLVTQPTIFETITHWDTALVGVDVKYLKTYSHPPYADDSAYDNLPDLIVEYIVTIAENVKQGGHRQLLQQIHSPDLTKLHHSPLLYPKQKSTLDSYAHIFSCYLTMIVRSTKEPIPGYPIHLTTEQTKLSLRLYSSSNDRTISDDDLHSQIHELSWALLSRHPIESTTNEVNTPILRFLIAHHLVQDGDGNFKKSTALSHTLSAIQWCWQAIGYNQCLRHAAEYLDGAFGAYRDRVKPYLQELEHTPFTTLRTIIHVNTTIAKTESSLPRFVMALDKSYFSVDGHPIPFTKFKEYAVGLISSAETKLYAVLRGWEFADIDKKIKTALHIGDHQNTFLDRLHDMGVGYSFFSDTRNPLKTDRHLLLKHFLREQNEEFAMYIPGATPSEVFKPVNCRLWLDEVDSLVSTLYAATVTTWPGAGRGSELDHLTYRNDHGKRHLFFINNILTFVTSYIKTQQITGRAPLIPRGIDPRLARVFIITINFVYYAASIISAQLNQHERSAAYTRYVFVFRGKPMNAERMTRVLREHTAPIFHIEFGIRDWRHVMKFVLRHKADIALEPDDEEEQNKDPINSLFGHSGRIGDHVYAIESSAMDTISAVDVTRAQRYGIEYQKSLGLWLDLSDNALGPATDEHMSVDKESSGSSAHLVTSMDANMRRQITKIMEDVIDRRLPVLGDQLTSMVAQALYNATPHPTPPYLPSSSAVTVHPSRLDAVSKLYHSNSFQSPQQAAMFEFILQNTYTVFGVLPTGGGKSLMFYGPSVIEEDGITVVISPFVALSDEQYETAQQLGISVGRWPSNTTDISTTRLLVVSAHAAGTNEFISFVRASVELGLIRRIIYDEAHQILLSAEYRDCYDTLPLITQTGVPVHFLSATLLQSNIDEITRISRIPPDTVYVIRAPTIRPNICYDAQHFSTVNANDASSQMMDRVEELLSLHVERLDEDGRVLVYCSSYKECDELFERTRYPIHRAKGSTGDDDEDDAKKRQAVAHDWRAGKPKVLIATTGFGNGIDYAHVRVVISVNPRNGNDAVQQTGRAGRDGQKSYAYILGSRPLIMTNIPDPDYAGVGIITMLYSTNDCIRIRLGEFDIESFSCISHGSSQALLCARCQILSYTKTMSLIPAQPGPTNYRTRPVNALGIESNTLSSRAVANNDNAPLRNATSTIHSRSNDSPPNGISVQHTLRDTSDVGDNDRPFETPIATLTRIISQANYPTPASLENTAIHRRKSRLSTWGLSVNETPMVSTPSISTYKDKGNGCATETRKTTMLPPPLPPISSPSTARRSITPVDDVFGIHELNQRPIPHHSPPVASQSNEQTSGRANMTAPILSTQRRYFSLPPIPPYSNPASRSTSKTPNTSQARQPIPQQDELSSSRTMAHSQLSPVTSLVVTQRSGRQDYSANVRSVTTSRQQAVTERQATTNMRKYYFAYIDRFFIIRESSCVVCSLLGNPSTSCKQDLYMTCASGLFNPFRAWVKFQDGDYPAKQFNTFRVNLRFDESQHVCFYCMRQTDIDAHPHATTKQTCAEYADVIKNFAWAVYCLPVACSKGLVEGRRWRDVLFATFPQQPPLTRPQYEEWLSTTPDPQGLNITNILLLCIRWSEMYYKQEWLPL